LLTESQVFENEVFAGTESGGHPAEEMPERHDHDKNLIGTVGIETFAKSLILRVYDVLAKHASKFQPSLVPTEYSFTSDRIDRSLFGEGCLTGVQPSYNPKHRR
jgi:hypothetical protein